MFKELQEKKNRSHHSDSAKKRETLKNTKTLFSGTFGDSRLFRFSWGVSELRPRQNEGWMYWDAAGCLLSCVLYQLVKDFP
jgi:putative component of toxin-antitoxin plasmid stabilization module